MQGTHTVSTTSAIGRYGVPHHHQFCALHLGTRCLSPQPMVPSLVSINFDNYNIPPRPEEAMLFAMWKLACASIFFCFIRTLKGYYHLIYKVGFILCICVWASICKSKETWTLQTYWYNHPNLLLPDRLAPFPLFGRGAIQDPERGMKSTSKTGSHALDFWTKIKWTCK